MQHIVVRVATSNPTTQQFATLQPNHIQALEFNNEAFVTLARDVLENSHHKVACLAP
jgi:hypothetical protein